MDEITTFPEEVLAENQRLTSPDKELSWLVSTPEVFAEYGYVKTYDTTFLNGEMCVHTHTSGPLNSKTHYDARVKVFFTVDDLNAYIDSVAGRLGEE